MFSKYYYTFSSTYDCHEYLFTNFVFCSGYLWLLWQRRWRRCLYRLNRLSILFYHLFFSKFIQICLAYVLFVFGVFFFLSNSYSPCVYSYTADIIKHLQLAQFFSLCLLLFHCFPRLRFHLIVSTNSSTSHLFWMYLRIFIPFLYKFFSVFLFRVGQLF